MLIIKIVYEVSRFKDGFNMVAADDVFSIASHGGKHI